MSAESPATRIRAKIEEWCDSDDSTCWQCADELAALLDTLDQQSEDTTRGRAAEPLDGSPDAKGLAPTRTAADEVRYPDRSVPAQEWFEKRCAWYAGETDRLNALVADLQSALTTARQERDAYREAGVQMHNGLVGHQMAGRFNAALAEDGVRLFDEAEALSGRVRADDAEYIQSFKGKWEAAEAALVEAQQTIEHLKRDVSEAESKHVEAHEEAEAAEQARETLRAAIEEKLDYFKDCRDAEMKGNKIEIATIRKTLNVVVLELEAALAASPSPQPPKDHV